MDFLSPSNFYSLVIKVNALPAMSAMQTGRGLQEAFTLVSLTPATRAAYSIQFPLLMSLNDVIEWVAKSLSVTGSFHSWCSWIFPQCSTSLSHSAPQWQTHLPHGTPQRCLLHAWWCSRRPIGGSSRVRSASQEPSRETFVSCSCMSDVQYVWQITVLFLCIYPTFAAKRNSATLVWF